VELPWSICLKEGGRREETISDTLVENNSIPFTTEDPPPKRKGGEDSTDKPVPTVNVIQVCMADSNLSDKYLFSYLDSFINHKTLSCLPTAGGILPK
jgi:hypothetical protein